MHYTFNNHKFDSITFSQIRNHDFSDACLLPSPTPLPTWHHFQVIAHQLASSEQALTIFFSVSECVHKVFKEAHTRWSCWDNVLEMIDLQIQRKHECRKIMKQTITKQKKQCFSLSKCKLAKIFYSAFSSY